MPSSSDSSVHHTRLSILVVGGGIAGLTAALALRHQGHTVRVLESSSWLRETGAAVILANNASIALLSLGLDPERDIKAARFQNALDYYLKEGEVPVFGEGGSGVQLPWVEMARTRFEGRYFMAHRVDLHQALVEKCVDPHLNLNANDAAATAEAETATSGPPVEVIRAERVVGWERAASHGTVRLHDGQEFQADLVVAADGIHSLAHVEVVGREVAVVPSGVSTTRFMLDTTEILEDPVTAPIMDDGDGCLVFYYTPSRKSVLMRYPCHSNELQNFGAYVLGDSGPTTQPPSLSLASEEVSREALIEQLDFMAPPFKALIRKADPALWNWKVGDRDPLPTYHRDKLVLIGDAAHPMLTLQAQGAAQAIEDGVTLGILFSKLHAKSDVADRLKLYDELRVLRSSRMQLLSRIRPTKSHAVEEMPQQLLDLFAPGLPPANTKEINEFKWDYDCVEHSQRVLQQHLHTARRGQ